MDKLNQNNEIFFNNYLNFNHQEILESIDRSKRDRRLRKNKNLIKLVSEVNLNINNFI
ncbi:MAG: hypothetical protein ACPL1F_06210 [bacterium]